MQKLTGEVSHLEEKVIGEKERYSVLWRLNCVQLQEHDEALASKDEEIMALRARVGVLEAHGRSEPPPRSEDERGGDVHREAVVPVSHPGRGPAHSPPSILGDGGDRVPLTTTSTGPVPGRRAATHRVGITPMTVPPSVIAPALGTL